MIVTFGAPGLLSSGVKSRPMIGATPRAFRKPSLM